jgi:hypothetical protein
MVEAPCGNLQGSSILKVKLFIVNRPLTPQQAAGNAPAPVFKYSISFGFLQSSST